MNSTLNVLRMRTEYNRLELVELIRSLREMTYYLDNSIAINELFEFNQHFIRTFKKKLINEKFDLNDTQLIDNCYAVFLNPINDPDYEVINYLNKQLLSSDYKIDFNLSIQLLRKIKQTHLDFIKNFRKTNRIVIDRIRNEKIRRLFEEIKSRSII